MNPRVVTVLSARPWEADLVAAARDTAAVRLVLRAYQPDDIDRQRSEIDVVVAGAETSWVTPAQIGSWRRSGLRVVGVYPAGDAPGRTLLEAGGAHEVVPDDTPASAILQAIRFLRPGVDVSAEEPQGQVVAVTGPRGAPGRSEVAFTLAWLWSRRHEVVLVDADLDAPALAIRLGRPPRPDLTDAADAVRATGAIPDGALHQVGALKVVVGSHRPGEPPLRLPLAEDVVEAAAAASAIVVLDLGPTVPDDRLLKRADHAVLVCDGSPAGLVRAARAAAEWSGPLPTLVVNRVERRARHDIVAAARKWTGLEPSALLAESPRVRAAARAAGPPDRAFARTLSRLAVPA